MLMKSVFAASVVVLAVAYALFYLYLAPISNVIVVGFDGFHGLNTLGTSSDILAVLASGAAIILINIILASALRARAAFLAYLLPFASLFISILILISVGVIIAVN